MKNAKKYLTIEEKKELLLKGERIPVCVYRNPKAEKERKKEMKQLHKNFSENISR